MLPDPQPHRPPPRVLVVTTQWWPSDARLALALRDAGCAVGALCPTGHPVRALPLERVYAQHAWRRLRTLSRAIRLDAPDLVVPADERSLRDLHRLHAAGTAAERRLIERSLGPPVSFGTLTSRLASLEAACNAGLRTADTIAAPNHAAVTRWAAETETVVLKSDGSSGGKGVRIARGSAAIAAAYDALRGGTPLAASLKRWLVNRDPFGLADALRRRPPAVVAQRLVTGRVGDLALFCRDGRVEGLAVAIQEQCGRPNGASTLIRMIEQPELAAGAARLVEQLRLSGFIGLDFIIDDATGEALVIEVNPRVTPLASQAPGPNGPAAAAARVLGAGGRPVRGATRSLIAYFPAAWRVDPLDPRLPSCAADVPTGEPALLAELVRIPWSDRSLPARLSALAGRVLTGRRRPGPLRWPSAAAQTTSPRPEGPRAEQATAD